MNKIVVILAVMLVALDSFAANRIYTTYRGDSRIMATGTASATVVEPVSIRAVRNLSFGMLTTKESGKVVLDEDNMRTSTGPGLATSKPSLGLIKIKGPKGYAVNVNIPSSYIMGNANKNARFEPKIARGGEMHSLTNGEVNLKISGTLHLDNKGIEHGIHKGVYIVQTSY